MEENAIGMPDSFFERLNKKNGFADDTTAAPVDSGTTPVATDKTIPSGMPDSFFEKLNSQQHYADTNNWAENYKRYIPQAEENPSAWDNIKNNFFAIKDASEASMYGGLELMSRQGEKSGNANFANFIKAAGMYYGADPNWLVKNMQENEAQSQEELKRVWLDPKMGQFNATDMFADPKSFFQTQLPQMLGGSATLMAAGMGIAKGVQTGVMALGAAGAPFTFGGSAVAAGFIGGAVASAISRPIESLMEGYGAFDEAYSELAKKYPNATHQQLTDMAMPVFNKTFDENMQLQVLDAVQIGLSIIPVTAWGKGALSGTGAIGRMARRADMMRQRYNVAAHIGETAFQMGTEGWEEGRQMQITNEAINKYVGTDKPTSWYDMLNTKEGQSAVSGGAFMGGMMESPGILKLAYNKLTGVGDDIKTKPYEDIKQKQTALFYGNIAKSVNEGTTNEMMQAINKFGRSGVLATVETDDADSRNKSSIAEAKRLGDEVAEQVGVFSRMKEQYPDVSEKGLVRMFQNNALIRNNANALKTLSEDNVTDAPIIQRINAQNEALNKENNDIIAGKDVWETPSHEDPFADPEKDKEADIPFDSVEEVEAARLKEIEALQQIPTDGMTDEQMHQRTESLAEINSRYEDLKNRLTEKINDAKGHYENQRVLTEMLQNNIPVEGTIQKAYGMHYDFVTQDGKTVRFYNQATHDVVDDNDFNGSAFLVLRKAEQGLDGTYKDEKGNYLFRSVLGDKDHAERIEVHTTDKDGNDKYLGNVAVSNAEDYNIARDRAKAARMEKLEGEDGEGEGFSVSDEQLSGVKTTSNEQAAEAQSYGFRNAYHALNSVNKYFDADYTDYANIPKEDLALVGRIKQEEAASATTTTPPPDSPPDSPPPSEPDTPPAPPTPPPTPPPAPQSPSPATAPSGTTSSTDSGNAGYERTERSFDKVNVGDNITHNGKQGKVFAKVRPKGSLSHPVVLAKDAEGVVFRVSESEYKGTERGESDNVLKTNGKLVSYRNDIGRIVVDEENNVIFEGSKSSVELGKTTDEEFAAKSIGDIGISYVNENSLDQAILVGDTVYVKGEEQELVRINYDKNGNVVSYTYKNSKGQERTNRNYEAALDVAIQKNNQEFDKSRKGASDEVKQRDEEHISGVVKAEYGDSIGYILETMPDEVYDTFDLMESGVTSLEKDAIQYMVLRTIEALADARKRIEGSNATKKEKGSALSMIEKFEKDLNKYYGKLDQQGKVSAKDVAKANTGENNKGVNTVQDAEQKTEAYHADKAAGKETELVKAAEDLSAPKVAPTTNTEGETQTTEAQLQEFGVPEQDIKPVTNVLTAMVDGLRKAGLTAAKTVGEFVGIGKGKQQDIETKDAIAEITQTIEVPKLQTVKVKEEVIETKTEQVSPTVNKITDVGEKIGGARKDLAEKLGSVTSEDIKSQPLSKVFPKPDFDKLISEKGISRDVAILLNYLYSKIPSKPRKSYQVSRWVDKVNEVIGIYRNILEEEGGSRFAERVIDGLRKSSTFQRDYNIYSAIINQLGFGFNPGTLEIKEFSRAGDGKKTFTIVNGRYIVKDYDTLEEAVNGLGQIVDAKKDKPKETKFDIYQDTKTKEYFVGKKGATGVNRIAEGFKTLKEAREFLKINQNQLQETWDALRDIPTERRKENRDRKGIDWRKGKNVDAEEFRNTFGFRGVEFGNWVNQNERQQSINEAYDALMDLASVLKLSPKSISLGGELGFAFGARGSGKYNAHYEPDKIVINLTKTKGAGSVAHEWWHGIDNYFSRKRGVKTGYVTESPTQRYKTDYVSGLGRVVVGKDESIRPEMIDAFKGVVDAIRNSKLPERSKDLDKGRSNVYWSTPIEMTARAFENFVIEKLAQTGYVNDYLANLKSVDEWIKDSKGAIDATKNYPYPLADEAHAVNESYQYFFDTIQEREEDGKSILFQQERGQGSFEEKYGVTFEQVEKLFESDYKNIYSGLERTFEELGVQQENLGNAIGDFMAEKVSRDLPSKLPNKKEKWDKDDLPRDRSLNVKPIPTKVKKVDLKTQQGKIEALKPITSKDDLRPNMQGVFHDADKKVLVATDAHKMVVIKDPTIKKTFIQDVRGKVVGLGKEIDGKYPDYSSVIPESAPIKQNVNVQQMLDETAGLARASDFFVDKDHLGIAAKITIGDKEFFFNPRLFNEVLTVFAQQGDKEVGLQLSQSNRALKIESGDVTAILMPVMGYDQKLDKSIPHKEIFRREETAEEKRNEIEYEIDYLKKNVKEAEGKLKLAVDALSKAKPSEKKSLEWDRNYEQRKYSEAKAALDAKESELLGIDNPIQEQSDNGTIKNAIQNGEITEQEASNFIESANTDEVESVIEAIESKAESENEVELNEVVEEVDDAVKGKVKPNPKQKGIRTNAQYRVAAGQRLIEALKDFSKAKNKRQATIAIIHEIMHPTVETIITGAKEGNAVGQKHTKTIVEEYNKANPDNKVTEEELIADNDKFVNGETTDKYRAVQEFIAKSWEQYHTEGGKGFSEAFQKVLDQITKAFQSVYKSLTGEQLTPELRKMFDDILGKEELSTDETTPTKEVSTSENKIKSWIDKWEELKKENDNEQLDLFYNKVKVALNGYAQGKGVVDEFTKLKSEIEQFAKERKAKPKEQGNKEGVSSNSNEGNSALRDVEAKNERLDDWHTELKRDKNVFWHGSPSGDMRGGEYGLHIGTHEAAKQALEARIGVKADGTDWDGTEEYGKTKLAGKETLKRLDPRGFLETGFNSGKDVPEQDYFPSERKVKATFGDKSIVPETAKPNIQPVRIKGEMSNSTSKPHEDFRANGLMKGQIKRGTAKRGYYYENVGEDAGSVSAVVPNKSHLEVIESPFKEALSKPNTNETTPTKEAEGVPSNSNEGNSALRAVESTAKALEGLGKKEFDKFINNDWAKLDTDVVDKIAFGFSSNEIKTLKPEQLSIKWKEDLDNVKFEQQKSGLSKTDWARKINLSEPIDVSFDGKKFNIEDGHHRYYAAKILGKELPVNLEIKANPTLEVIKNKSKIAEAYHKAKADGSNPELVKAVEELLDKPKETSPTPNSKGEGTAVKYQIEESRDEPLASVNPALAEYIRQRMQRLFPSVALFSDKASFEAAAKKVSKGVTFSSAYIGAAIKNLVYVDAEKALQHTEIHEYAHIYWDALPADHPLKTALLDKFGGNEEAAIDAIGRAGTIIMENELDIAKSGFFEKWLKKFWAAVKGVFTSKSIEQAFAERLLTNADEVTEENITSGVVKYMKMKSSAKYSELSEKAVKGIEKIIGKKISSLTFPEYYKHISTEIKPNDFKQWKMLSPQKFLEKMYGIVSPVSTLSPSNKAVFMKQYREYLDDYNWAENNVWTRFASGSMTLTVKEIEDLYMEAYKRKSYGTKDAVNFLADLYSKAVMYKNMQQEIKGDTFNKPFAKMSFDMMSGHEITDLSGSEFVSGKYSLLSPDRVKETILQGREKLYREVQRNATIKEDALKNDFNVIWKKVKDLKSDLRKIVDKTGTYFIDRNSSAYKALRGGTAADRALADLLDMHYKYESAYGGLSMEKGKYRVPVARMDFGGLAKKFGFKEGMRRYFAKPSKYDNVIIDVRSLGLSKPLMTLKQARQEMVKGSNAIYPFQMLKLTKKVDALTKEAYKQFNSGRHANGDIVTTEDLSGSRYGVSFVKDDESSEDLKVSMMLYHYANIENESYDLLSPYSMYIQKYLGRKDKPNMLKWVKMLDDDLIKGESPTSNLGVYDKYVQALTNYTHWLQLGFNIAGMPFNAFAGFAQSVREIGFRNTLRGLRRVIGSLTVGGGAGVVNAKAISIMEKLHIVSLSKDLEMSVTSKIGKGISKIAFLPVSFVEYINHAYSFIGAMDDAEWERLKALPANASAEDYTKAMGGNERVDELHTLTQKINGAYSKYSRRGINKTAEGRALMQFKNWLPDVIFAHLTVSQLNEAGEDLYGEYQSGIATSIKNTVWNKTIIPMFKDKSIAQAKKNWETLSEHEQMQVGKAMRQLVILGGMALWIASLDDRDDKELKRMLKRAMGDVTYIFDVSNMQFLFDNTVPVFGTIKNLLGLVAEVFSTATGNPSVYEKRQGSHMRGDLKLPVMIENQTPVVNKISKLVNEKD